MNAKNPTINDGSQVQIIKDLTTGFPNVCIAVLVLTFVVETVDLGDLSGFMVASKKSDSIWISVGERARWERKRIDSDL